MWARAAKSLRERSHYTMTPKEVSLHFTVAKDRAQRRLKMRGYDLNTINDMRDRKIHYLTGKLDEKQLGFDLPSRKYYLDDVKAEDLAETSTHASSMHEEEPFNVLSLTSKFFEL